MFRMPIWRSQMTTPSLVKSARKLYGLLSILSFQRKWASQILRFMLSMN